MKDLPRFKPRSRKAVEAYISRVLADRQRPEESHLLALIAYRDGHYRAIFDGAYFTLQEGHDRPSKSQWNTLKKKMKRHDRRVFVFKAHGEIDCPDAAPGDSPCYYVDFGFFAE